MIYVLTRLLVLLMLVGGPALAGNTDFRQSSFAAKTPPQTLEILDGVRRAKAADPVGNPTIPAHILIAEGKVVGTQNLPVSQLLSPKPSIDVNTTVNMDRFMNTLNQTKAVLFLHQPWKAWRGMVQSLRR